MNTKRMKIDDFLFQCNLRISNSISDDAILSKVSKYGYTQERMLEGENLLKEARLLHEKYMKEHGDVNQAFDNRNKEHKQAHTTYMQMLTISQIVFKNDSDAIVTLQLNGHRATTLSSWITQTYNFYNNLLGNETWIKAMGKFNITRETIEAARNEVVNVDKYVETIMKEKGDAQRATLKRDAKFEELGEWVNDYESIAKVALYDDTQMLEKLGIVVK
ncbi:MAG: hypothetical protein JW717_07875 [Marinilabiliaceae bacterium]|nr:hypothetical protein [Marinilabiliaceae bacterium]